ncbi:unnamed protein product, partial [Closterium sp. Yama58-4]
YPYDPLDRIWDADGVMATSGGAASSTLMFDYSFDSFVFGTPINVKPAIGATATAAASADASGVGDSVPPFIQLTARTVPQAPTGTMDSSSGLEYQFQFLESPASFQLILYFANVEGRVKRVGDMVFDIVLNEQVVVGRFDFVDLYTPAVLLLRPAATSRLPPAISGIEMYEVFPAAKPTPAAEVSALRDFQALLGAPASLEGWQGSDPCNPIKWAGIQCIQAQGDSESHVSGIYLGNYSLHGPISPSLANLSRLQHLWVNDNGLVKEIPSSLGDLGDLSTLLLQNNQLQGQVPQSLTNLTNLVQLQPHCLAFPRRPFPSLWWCTLQQRGKQQPHGSVPLSSLPPCPFSCSPLRSPLSGDARCSNVANNSLTGVFPFNLTTQFIQVVSSNSCKWCSGQRPNSPPPFPLLPPSATGNDLCSPQGLYDLPNCGALPPPPPPPSSPPAPPPAPSPISPSPPSEPSVPPSPTADSSGTGRTVLIGSVVGSLLVAAIASALVVWMYFRGVRKDRVKGEGGEKEREEKRSEVAAAVGGGGEGGDGDDEGSGKRSDGYGGGSGRGGGSAPAFTAATDAATGAAAAAAAATAAAAAAAATAAAAAAAGAAAEVAHNGQKAPPNGLAVEPAPFTVPPTHVQRMSLAELEEATGGFCEEQMIGAGGFGPVYRGVLANGRVVAVKRRAVDSMQGSTEFNNELKFLSKIRHPHLVALIAFCEEQGQQLLVYEFMAQGNLREHLYDRLGAPRGRLRWLQRLSIAVGAAKGIEYLHVALRPSIIHRDIKTTNILLDDSLCAKVADFGLSRLGPQDNTHVSTNVKGTAGYLDPEYYTVQQLTDRSDVFSFGVVLLELVSGRQPIDLSRPRVDWNIIDWARKHLQQGDIEAIVDPTLPPSEYLLDAMWKVAEVGILCVEPMGINRPSISEVVRELGEAVAMELSNTPEGYDSEIGVDYGDERGGGRGGGGEEGGRGGERLGGRRGYYNSTLTFSRSGSNGGDSPRGTDGRRQDGGRELEARDRGFGRGENPNRVVPAELAMSWRGVGGEASGGMRGDGDGSGEMWAGGGGVSGGVSQGVSEGVSEGMSGRVSGRVGWGGSKEGVAGMGGGDRSGSSAGRHGEGGGGEGGGGGGSRRREGGGGEGGSAMGFRGPGRGGEMYIRRGGSSEELVSGSGVQGGAMQGDLMMAQAPHGDYMMLRKVHQGVMSPPIPQEKRHFSAEDKPRFASPFGQPGFQPRAGGRDFESAREPVGGHGAAGNSEVKRRMSEGEVVSLTLVPAASALRYVQAELPPKLDYASCAAEVEEWVDVHMAETHPACSCNAYELLNHQLPSPPLPLFPPSLFTVPVVSLALVPSAAALRYGQAEPPPKLDYALCAAEVEEWVDVQMAETAEVHPCPPSCPSPHTSPLSPVVSLTLAHSAAALRYGQSEPPPRLDYASCAAEVEEWVDVQMAETAEVQWQREERAASGESPMPQTLFFLHVARAGGRTYHQCFLSTLMPSTVQCNMSYHVLRDDPTMGCRLLATHDDYGMTTQLPPGAATGVTTLFREPLDRVLSMYEFSVHISGRSMGLDLKQLPDETLYAARRKMREHYRNLVPTDTRNVWPWTLLSVTMEEDLWDRRDFTGIPPPPLGFDEGRDDMYSHAHLVMPLRDFIELPLAHDVVHNGATFQLAGITNNSVLPEAKRLRQCVLQHPDLGGDMLKLAKARVDALIHLGFTDRMEESIELLLAVIDRSLSSQAFTLPGKNPRGRCKRPKKKTKEGERPWKSIREQYAECLKDQMELTQLNELIAFRHMGPLKFSRKERARIPEDVMRRIKELNALDLELTEYARDKYTQMLDKYRPMMEAVGNPSTDRC